MSATDNRSPLGDTVTNWLHHLYGHAEAGWLTLFSVDATTGDRFTDWAPIIDTSDAVAHATTRATTCDVWFGVATRTEPLGANRRGGGPDCAELPGLWLDIDIVGPGHRQGGRLAADEPAARALLDAFTLPPTTVVHSGGGLQAWWLFAEMVPVDDQALTLLAAWGTTWSRIADAQGIDIDNVFDVARVMRLPGTTNRKEGGARPVTVTDADWDRRYGLDDLDQHLDAPPAPPAHRTGTAVPYIGPERPGTAYNVRHTGGDVLRSHGFTLARTDRNGDEHWTRPGKDTREGTSATVYAVLQFAVVLAASVHFLQIHARTPTVELLGYLAWVMLSLSGIGRVLARERGGWAIEVARHLAVATALPLAGRWFAGEALPSWALALAAAAAIASAVAAWRIGTAERRAHAAADGVPDETARAA